MPRTLAYLRVSTPGQTTDNQFTIEPHRLVTETVSGSTPVGWRRGSDRLEAGDVLVVTKFDRLGRNAMDVSATVARLDELGVRVHCPALGEVGSTDKLTMGVINTVAEFVRDLLIERLRPG